MGRGPLPRRPGAGLLLAFAAACLLGRASASRSLLQAAAAPPLANGGGGGAASADGSCCAQLAAIGFSSNLPVVVLDTAGRKVEEKGVSVPVRLCTCSSGASFKDYDGLATAAVRGSSSANATKKSFELELLKPGGAGAPAAEAAVVAANGAPDGGAAPANATGGKAGLKANDFPFLGMPKDQDWILYGGDEADLTQGMRNWLAYNLFRAAGRYATRTVWCEVFLRDDGAPALSLAHYNGIYQGQEKMKIAPHRVNVSKLTPPDLSGGYLLGYDNDNTQVGDVQFGPLKGWDHPFRLRDPKQAGPEALAYLQAYLQSVQDALDAPDWLTRSPSYTSLIDSPSWLDYFLHTELTKNPDGYRGSVLLHKDRSAPLAAGPPWDYNEAFGLCCGYPMTGWDKQGASGPGQSGGSAISPEGWRFMICAEPERCIVDPTDGLSPWYRRMWSDARFSSAAAARWAQLRSGPWSDAALQKMIADNAALIKPAVLRNFKRYEQVLLKPWYTSAEQEWTAEVATLQGWLLKHVAWMDGGLRNAAGAAPAPAG